MAAWLVLAYAPNSSDFRFVNGIKAHLRQNVKESIQVYFITFGPTIRSVCTVCKITSQNVVEVMQIPNSDWHSVIRTIKIAINYLRLSNVSIDAVCVCGHGSSFVLSQWKNSKYPFMTLKDMVKLLMDPFKPKLVAFDCCYAGSMSCLYEMPSYVKYVVASPGLIPFISLLKTKTFVSLRSFRSDSDIKSYAADMACEWQEHMRAPFGCMLAFDISKIEMIAKLFKIHYSDLQLDKESIHDMEDHNQLDLFIAARDVPQLQKAVKAALVSQCKPYACGKLQGVAIERWMHRKFQKEFKETRWYRRVMKTLWAERYKMQ